MIQNFSLEFNDQASSGRHKTLDSEVVLQYIETNPGVGNIWRVWTKFTISLANLSSPLGL